MAQRNEKGGDNEIYLKESNYSTWRLIWHRPKCCEGLPLPIIPIFATTLPAYSNRWVGIGQAYTRIILGWRGPVGSVATIVESLSLVLYIFSESWSSPMACQDLASGWAETRVLTVYIANQGNLHYSTTREELRTVSRLTIGWDH